MKALGSGQSERLAEAVRRLRVRPQPPQHAASAGTPSPPRLTPCCPFEALLDQRQNDLERGLDEVRGRVNGLLFLLAGTVLTQVILKLVG